MSVTDGPILAATVVVPDLAAAASVYTDALGYETLEVGAVSPSLADAWADPQLAGAASALLGPGRAMGAVRLVERPTPIGDDQPLRHCGWRAIEISVADVRALHGSLLASRALRVVGAPAPLTSNPAIHAMQAVGPGGELLYLTEVSTDSAFRLPAAARPVDRVFIAVLSAPDVDAALRFYGELLGADIRLDAPGPLSAVNRLLGLDPHRAHRITAAQLRGDCVVEIDAHPPELPGTRVDRSRLPPGTAMMTFAVDDLDALRPRMLADPVAAGGELYAGRRSGTVIGPAGEHIELVGA